MGHATGTERRIVIRWQACGQATEVGNALHRAYPADETPSFTEALDAIDETERRIWDPDGAADKPE